MADALYAFLLVWAFFLFLLTHSFLSYFFQKKKKLAGMNSHKVIPYMCFYIAGFTAPIWGHLHSIVNATLQYNL